MFLYLQRILYVHDSIFHNRLLAEMCKTVPDGIVCFFVSYQYLEAVVNEWADSELIKTIRKYKLVFVETQDAVETALALESYRKVRNLEVEHLLQCCLLI